VLGHFETFHGQARCPWLRCTKAHGLPIARSITRSGSGSGCSHDRGSYSKWLCVGSGSTLATECGAAENCAHDGRPVPCRRNCAEDRFHLGRIGKTRWDHGVLLDFLAAKRRRRSLALAGFRGDIIWNVGHYSARKDFSGVGRSLRPVPPRRRRIA
jgi:hypothetical protein